MKYNSFKMYTIGTDGMPLGPFPGDHSASFQEQVVFLTSSPENKTTDLVYLLLPMNVSRPGIYHLSIQCSFLLPFPNKSAKKISSFTSPQCA